MSIIDDALRRAAASAANRVAEGRDGGAAYRVEDTILHPVIEVHRNNQALVYIHLIEAERELLPLLLDAIGGLAPDAVAMVVDQATVSLSDVTPGFLDRYEHGDATARLAMLGDEAGVSAGLSCLVATKYDLTVRVLPYQLRGRTIEFGTPTGDVTTKLTDLNEVPENASMTGLIPHSLARSITGAREARKAAADAAKETFGSMGSRSMREATADAATVSFLRHIDEDSVIAVQYRPATREVERWFEEHLDGGCSDVERIERLAGGSSQ